MYVMYFTVFIQKTFFFMYEMTYFTCLQFICLFFYRKSGILLYYSISSLGHISQIWLVGYYDNYWCLVLVSRGDNF